MRHITAKIARILVLVIAAHILLPSAYAFKPGPALQQQAKRTKALQRLFSSIRMHNTFMRIRTSDGETVEGYATQVTADSVTVSHDQQSSRSVRYGAIEKVYVNNLTQREVAEIGIVALIMIAAIVGAKASK